MLNTLQISDFEMHSRNQDLNLKSLRDNLKKNCLEHPLLKMETDIRLKLIRLPFLKNQLTLASKAKAINQRNNGTYTLNGNTYGMF